MNLIVYFTHVLCNSDSQRTKKVYAFCTLRTTYMICKKKQVHFLADIILIGIIHY